MTDIKDNIIYGALMVCAITVIGWVMIQSILECVR